VEFYSNKSSISYKAWPLLGIITANRNMSLAPAHFHSSQQTSGNLALKFCFDYSKGCSVVTFHSSAKENRCLEKH